MVGVGDGGGGRWGGGGGVVESLSQFRSEWMSD